MFNANLRPGEVFLLFDVYSGCGEVTRAGHPVTSKYTKTNISFYAVLAEADSREITEWRQNNHPITHTVVQYGAGLSAKPTDYLITCDGRQFCVKGVSNAGGLNVAMIYKVEERYDKNELVGKLAGNEK